ncbi:MAG: hypothetical protein ACI4JW_05430 [Oscillospiraceae bacterium]
MVDNKKIDELKSLLRKRSGLRIREALARFYAFLSPDETKVYEKEVDHLLETLGVEVDLPF